MKKQKITTVVAAAAASLLLTSIASAFSVAADEVKHDQEQKYDNTANTWSTAYADQNTSSVITENTSQYPVYPSAKQNVAYSSNPTFTVTIPADVTFKENLDDEKREVKVENVFLNENDYIYVTVQSANNYQMHLDGSIDPKKAIPYTLTSDQSLSENNPSSGKEIIKTDKDATATLTYHVNEENRNITTAGNYSDLLTFTIAVY